MDLYDDVPRYRKKSAGKHAAKSDHKHVYESCVFGYFGIRLERGKGWGTDDKLSYTIGTYCPVCGKIGRIRDPKWLRDERTQTPLGYAIREVYSDEALREMDQKTRTLPFFFLSDPYNQKSVQL